MHEANDQSVFLEAWRNPRTEVRIAVESWSVQEPIKEQFIERVRSPRMVWNYFVRIGPVAVWRKIRSRLAEDRRNSKIAGVGVGRILDFPSDSSFETGQRVIFFAPNHSPEWPHLSLDIRLIIPTPTSWKTQQDEKPLELSEWLRTYAGWSPYSGAVIDSVRLKQELIRFTSDYRFAAVENSYKKALVRKGQERLKVDGSRTNLHSGVLFGLGNYAKTQIVPHVRKHLHLSAIHEIDSDQIVSAVGLAPVLDTSPWPRDGETYDAWFIAGFHHTHAALATQALQNDAYAVVEKPLVTTRRQFSDLQVALKGTSRRKLFTCFQKRYSKLNEWARKDLAVALGDPVDMHCMIYEIPLPVLHWYNWPNSGSRLISNGCHWLDYFLFINGFSPVSGLGVQCLRGSDLIAWVQLDNGSQMTMSLTDTGSQRLGVREVIDLRGGDVTVRLTDATYYSAENSSRVLRHRRVNPMDAYSRMYDSICRQIASGLEGDAIESLRSTALMLDLEDELTRQKS